MTTRLCRDCRHSGYRAMVAFAASHGSPERHCPPPSKLMRCHHPVAVEADLVTGAERAEFALTMRSGRLCGEDGKLWEASDAQDS